MAYAVPLSTQRKEGAQGVDVYLASGASPDSWISAGGTLLTAVIASGTAIVTTFFQKRSHKRDTRATEDQWRKQAKELRDLLRIQYESQITYLRDELKAERARNRRRRSVDD